MIARRLTPALSDQKLRVVERRQRDRRTRWGRRRPDALAGLAESPRLLLIEPHEDTRLLYACLFEQAGYAVYSVANGLAAVGVAQRRLPDAVIMEVAVPGADGFEILRQLQSDSGTASIPVVVVTSVLHFDVPARARASGAVIVLAKPTEADLLLAAVDDAIMATPQNRLVARQLRRPLLALREIAKRFEPDASAQERMRVLIDRLQVAVLALDEHGRYVAVSPGASTLIGYSRSELLTMSIFDSALGVDLPIARHWQDFLTDQPSSPEMTIRDRRGNRLNIQTAFETILPGLHATAFATSAERDRMTDGHRGHDGRHYSTND
jgi:PAS domain S-box-containing protein